MFNPTPRIGRQNFDVCLHRNAIPEPCGCVQIGRRGAIFKMPRRLDVMSDIVLCIEWCGAGCARRTVRIEATVIGCSETGAGAFETTVIFLSGGDGCGPAEFRHLPN